MKIGDLVRSIHGRTGLIVAIDPLRENSMKKYDKIGELVILMSDGVLWYCCPKGWEAIDEKR